MKTISFDYPISSDLDEYGEECIVETLTVTGTIDEDDSNEYGAAAGTVTSIKDSTGTELIGKNISQLMKERTIAAGQEWDDNDNWMDVAICEFPMFLTREYWANK